MGLRALTPGTGPAPAACVPLSSTSPSQCFSNSPSSLSGAPPSPPQITHATPDLCSLLFPSVETVRLHDQLSQKTNEHVQAGTAPGPTSFSPSPAPKSAAAVSSRLSTQPDCQSHTSMPRWPSSCLDQSSRPLWTPLHVMPDPRGEHSLPALCDPSHPTFFSPV